MLSTRIALAFVIAAGAFAEQPTPEKTFVSAADITALMAKAKADRKEGQALVGENILQLSPYSVNLEYRPAPFGASVHEKEAELFYVLDGSGTLVTGGTITEEKRTNPENRIGKAIEGGTARTISKGDVIFVPENTPHWFSSVESPLFLMSMHVPRPVPGK